MDLKLFIVFCFTVLCICWLGDIIGNYIFEKENKK